MNASGTPHEIHSLSGAYAVDALDDAERALFEEHLSACADCRAEVASIREASALFGEVSATTPPPALRDRVLADISSVRPLPPEDTAADAPVALEQRRRPRRWVRPLAAAAAVVALVGGGAVVWQTTQDDTPTISAVDQVLRSRDVEHVSVDLPDGSSATVFTSRARDRAVLVTEGMAPAPSGKVYQLWLQKDGVMVPAGLMDGSGDQTLALEGDLAGATAAGITVEPEGGSEEPTSAPVALFDFGQES